MTLALDTAAAGAPPVLEKAGFLGVLMLDTRFPRPPGDVGHPDTFTVPTRFAVISGAWPDKVVQSGAGLRAARVVNAFIFVARAQEQGGAKALTTSCGFLVLLQKELQAAVKIPVVTSSLLQLPGLLAIHRRVGVLTISAAKLGAEHLRAAGVAKARLTDVVIEGVAPHSEFAQSILQNRSEMDLAQAEKDVVAAALALKAKAPELKAIVLECTNMPPYRAAIEAATGMKTYALMDDARLLKPWT